MVLGEAAGTVPLIGFFNEFKAESSHCLTGAGVFSDPLRKPGAGLTETAEARLCAPDSFVPAASRTGCFGE